MTNEAIIKFIETKNHTDKSVLIHFKQRSTITGLFIKGNDYNELMSMVREKVKAIICLGVDNRKIIDVFGNVVDIMVEVTNMADAVRMAQRLSEKGDTVLLSPACASFDLFENYEDRGRQFKQAVHNL